MSVWFISRHQGAIDWIKKQDICIDYFVTHVDVDMIQEQDIVIGTLPIHIAAQVCAKGARFYFLSVNVHSYQRGKELSVEELIQQGCKLEEFSIKKL